tara:strand:- start:23 stop:358 length:336 start_codon:yes stop_codon:yes gene_type:complete
MHHGLALSQCRTKPIAVTSANPKTGLASSLRLTQRTNHRLHRTSHHRFISAARKHRAGTRALIRPLKGCRSRRHCVQLQLEAWHQLTSRELTLRIQQREAENGASVGKQQT